MATRGKMADWIGKRVEWMGAALDDGGRTARRSGRVTSTSGIYLRIARDDGFLDIVPHEAVREEKSGVQDA